MAGGDATGHAQTELPVPVVYKTVEGMTIVEDEMLCFMVNQMKFLPHDTIVQLVLSTFKTKEIEQSKKTLYEVCESNHREIKHKGNQKDDKNVRDCIKLLNEKGEDTPRFVSHNLKRLPPITFESIDVTALLGRITSLEASVSNLKDSVERQVNTSENLHTMSVALDDRIQQVENAAPTRAAHTPNAPARDPPLPQQGRNVPQTVMIGYTGETQLLTLAGPTQPMQWSKMVRDGRRIRAIPEDVNTNANTSSNRSRPANGRRKIQGFTGTGAPGNVGVITTKMISVFATRFDPNLEADALCEYLKEKLDREVECSKIETERKRFSSFLVKAECKDKAEMYDPSVWPEGAYVRPYFYDNRKKDARPAATIPAAAVPGNNVVPAPVTPNGGVDGQNADRRETD